MFNFNPKTNTIQITQGDDIVGFSFQVTDQKDLPVSLVGSTLSFTVKSTPDTDGTNSNAFISKNLNIVDSESGVFELNLTNVETSPENLPAGVYFYDIQQNVEVSSNIFNYVTILKGIFEVTYQITVN